MGSTLQLRPLGASSSISAPGSSRRQCGTTATGSESLDRTPTATLTKTTQMVRCVKSCWRDVVRACMLLDGQPHCLASNLRKSTSLLQRATTDQHVVERWVC
jgi:hypothetical protein